MKAVLRARGAHAVLLAIVGGYFIVLWAVGGRYHWDILGVPVLHFPYGDLRSVTSAWECTRKGISVMAANPCDPMRRSANYPGIWMAPSHLGFGVGDTIWLGRAIAAAFLVAAIAVLPAGARVADAFVYGAAVCSPSVMLGIDRGNVDILLFALVVLAVLLYRHGHGRAAPLAHALVLFTAVLKLFPIFAAGLFLGDRSRRGVLLLSATFAAFGVYCLWILDELRVIWRVTPQPSDYAYGIRICSEWIASLAGNTSLRALDLVIAVVVVVGVVILRRRLHDSLPIAADMPGRRDLDLFVAGAGIYVLTYVLFRSYEYRLVFLLLALPQLLRWARAGRALAQLSLAALLAVLWLDLRPKANVFGFHTPLAVVALEQLVLFALLAAALAATFVSPPRAAER